MKIMRYFYKMAYDWLWHPIFWGWVLIQLQHISKSKAGRKSFYDRLALFPPLKSEKRPVLWVHGSSLGEALSLLPFLEKLRGRFSHTQVFSTSTPRGQYVALQKSKAERVIYLPLDISYFVRKGLRKLSPDLLVIFETEIWPNLFWECEKMGIPVLVISGRISPRSFKRYRRARFFFREVISHAYFLMQSEEDVHRIREMGAPRENVAMGGDIKLDGIKMKLTESEEASLRDTFGSGGPTWVAGSTHPGEEETLLDVYGRLVLKFPSLRLILAPRHLDRMEIVREMVARKKIPYLLRSRLPIQGRESGVVLLDSYGELSRVYALANVVFIGGTLSPIGGHNLMEAAALGKPVLFGPHISNCKNQARLLLEKQAGIQVKDGNELESQMAHLLDDPSRAISMGEKGREAILANQGAMEKCIARVEEIIRNTKAP